MNQVVTYEMFGAIGDGENDDMPAIVKAHEEANRRRLPVRAKEGAIYYISPKDMTAKVCTNVDWTGAKFIIDDRDCENIYAPVFEVLSLEVLFGDEASQKDLTLEIDSLECGQRYIHNPLNRDVYVIVHNSHHMDYIRRGLNQNNGSPRTDNFILRADGTLPSPVAFEFTEITDMTVKPIDSEKLVLRGGEFLTIANQAQPLSNYYNRGIMIKRSNTEISGFTHLVIGELEHGAPYRGFLNITECAQVYAHDCIFTGHRIYRKTAYNGQTVPMGTYDINIDRAASVTLARCTQTTDIYDRSYWGIMGSNFCRDLLLEDCVLSRFDAHQGVTNCTLRRCTFGWHGSKIIGSGNLLIEEVEGYGYAFVSMREDYGSTWNGDVTIKDCVWHPSEKTRVILDARNDGMHDFGYQCYLPQNVVIDGFTVVETSQDSAPLYVFSDYSGSEDIPFHKREHMPVPPVSVQVRNVHTYRSVELCGRKELVMNTSFIM